MGWKDGWQERQMEGQVSVFGEQAAEEKKDRWRGGWKEEEMSG